MADKSNFVLRWEIDNATAVHAAGKTESKVFSEGGFEWKIQMEKDEDRMKFALGCGLNQNRHWNCEGSASIRLFATFAAPSNRNEEKFLFDDYNILWRPKFNFPWNILTSHFFNANDKVKCEFHVHIINSKRDRPILYQFAAPNNKSNGILKIGDEKLHVSKELLAVHSPVFDALFFGDFAEKGKEEVELKDVVCEEFLDLLNVIYLKNVNITDRTALHLFKLADQFQIECVLDMSKEHLLKSEGISMVQKLIVADKYNLAELRDHCLNSVSSVAELNEKLKSCPEAANFSDEMKAAIYDRNWQLIQ